MSYELRIWDPSRHGPAPTSADGALDLVESLLDTPAGPNSALERFGQSLFLRLEATHDSSVSGDVTLAEFWGGDPRQQTRACETAVFPLSLPEEDGRRLALAVDAASRAGLALLDDENGMCFLPGGVVYPEDTREMWASMLDELRAGPPAPGEEAADSRTLLQRIAGELFDAIGRGNPHR